METLILVGLSNAAWAAALAIVAAFATKLMPRRQVLIHAMWILVLLKLVTPSLVQVDVSRFAAETRPEPTITGEALPPTIAEPQPSVRIPTTSSRRPKADVPRLTEFRPAPPLPVPTPRVSKRDWLVPFVLLWLIGSFLWFSSIAIGIVRFRRLLGSALPASEELRDQVERTARKLGLRRTPATYLVSASLPPMLWALVGSPRLILPEGLWSRLDDDERETILAHELAHLKRRDEWTRRLEAIALGLYWWNPVAWWARREVERTEEQCCDAWVLWALPGAASAYARALVRTADFLSESSSRHPWPAGASGAGHLPLLKRRLTMILNADGAGPIPKPRKVRRGVAILAGLALLLLPAWALSESPKAEPSPESLQAALDAFKAKYGDYPPSRILLAKNTDDLPAGVATIQAQPEQKPAPKPPMLDAPPEIADKVKFARVTSGEVQDNQQFVGILESISVQIRAPRDGIIECRNKKSGDIVETDDRVFEYDDADQQEDVKQARLEVDRIEKEQRRLLRISRPGEPAILLITEELREAEKKLASTRTKYFKGIGMPIKGVIQHDHAPGEHFAVTSGEVIATIISATDSLRVSFKLNEASFLQLRRSKSPSGGKPALGIDAPVELSIAGQPEWYAGKIVEIGSKFDPKTQSIRCLASLPNPDELFLPGMSAKVKINVGSPRKMVLLPTEAWKGQFDGGKWFVGVVNDQDEVERRNIKIGETQPNGWPVIEGLKEGDWVATKHSPFRGQTVWKVKRQ